MKKIIPFFLLYILLSVCLKAQIITTVAGGGSALADGVPATTAKLQHPCCISLDGSDNLYFGTLLTTPEIKMIDAAGIIHTVAGTGVPGFSGDGGPATLAQIQYPTAAVDPAGNIYIADRYNYRIRRVDAITKIITTVAGTGVGTSTGDGGQATAATLEPYGVCIDGSGNLYCVDSATMIRKIDPLGIITTIAGSKTAGFSGDGGPATAAKMAMNGSMCFDATFSNLYVDCDTRVRRINISTGTITTFAGNGSPFYSGDGIAATAAEILVSYGICMDNSGNMFIADDGNERVRKVDIPGIIYTVAGIGVAAFSGDGGTATAAAINSPAGVATDRCGNLFIADAANDRIRKVHSGTYVTPTISISATPGSTVCTGTSVTYTATVSNGGSTPTYQWYKNGTVVSTGSNYTYTPTNNDSVRCVLTSSNPCVTATTAYSNTITMTVNTVVTPGISITAAPAGAVCAGTYVTYTATTTGGGASPGHVWYVNGAVAGTGGSYGYTPTHADSIRAVLTSSDACASPASAYSNRIIMTVNPVAVPTVTANVSPNDTVCESAMVTFSTAITGASVSTPGYQWYKNGAVVGTGSVYSYTPATNDSVRVVVTGSTPCISGVTAFSNSVHMRVEPNVVAGIFLAGSTSAAPIGSNVLIAASLTNVMSGYVIRWMNKGVLFATTTTNVLNYTKGPDTDTITATVTPTGSYGCYNAATSGKYVVRALPRGVGVASIGQLPITVYPNPAGDVVYVDGLQSAATFRLLDVVGRVVKDGALDAGLNSLPVDGLASGVYVLEVSDAVTGKRMTSRVVKQ